MKISPGQGSTTGSCYVRLNQRYNPGQVKLEVKTGGCTVLVQQTKPL